MKLYFVSMSLVTGGKRYWTDWANSAKHVERMARVEAGRMLACVNYVICSD